LRASQNHGQSKITTSSTIGQVARSAVSLFKTRNMFNEKKSLAGRQQMILDDCNFQNLTTIRKSGWTWISFSLLAKSVSFLVQQENSAGFLVNLDAPETNFSKAEVWKCSEQITAHENCEVLLRKVILLDI
jgi:hypothetical protein